MSHSELRVRVITACVLTGLLGLACWAAATWPAGRWVLVALLGAATVLAAREVSRMCDCFAGRLGDVALHICLLLPLAAGLVWNGAAVHEPAGLAAAPILLAVLLGTALAASFGFLGLAVSRREDVAIVVRQVAMGAAGLQLLSGGACLTLMAALGGRVGPVLWLFLVVCCNDIGAYFAGKTLSGPKFAPQISPAKTWSGSLGGVACGLIAGVLGRAWLPMPGALWQVLLMCLFVVGAAQSGDLLKSLIKRMNSRKDSGSLLPGHGGVLDRLDGVWAAAPLYLLLLLILGGSW